MTNIIYSFYRITFHPCVKEMTKADFQAFATSLHLAAELGFEPRQTAPEAVVLPLHNSAPRLKLYH